MKKTFESFGFRFFVGDVTSGEGFSLFYLRLPGPAPHSVSGSKVTVHKNRAAEPESELGILPGAEA